MPIKELRVRKHLQEASYFEQKNREVLARLKARHKKPRLSPITGEPMEEVNIMGVLVDRCPKSHGVWLDAGELDQLLKIAKHEERSGEDHWVEKILTAIKKNF